MPALLGTVGDPWAGGWSSWDRSISDPLSGKGVWPGKCKALLLSHHRRRACRAGGNGLDEDHGVLGCV